ncbi:hypothetical protein U9M48_014019 [Paspalum notatum var. saurae]|uniref:Uncharacterized protein n=1 Tax=Paspalum notatum var. saurae TaxID=547442 RepID=A0AAQ3T3D5_PASNO
MASSSASSRSVGGGSGYEVPPVPYRERPLEYEPAVFCHCHAKAAQFISWSDTNPGMRFLKCAKRAQQMTISALQAELEDARREKSVLQLELQDADRANVGVERGHSDTATRL